MKTFKMLALAALLSVTVSCQFGPSKFQMTTDSTAVDSVAVDSLAVKDSVATDSLKK